MKLKVKATGRKRKPRPEYKSVTAGFCDRCQKVVTMKIDPAQEPPGICLVCEKDIAAGKTVEIPEPVEPIPF